MSSFLIVTENGPPDIMVEVGEKVSKDPVLLSGLFQAIVSLSSEVAGSPLQVIQLGNYTVMFRQLKGVGRLLMVGSTSNIRGIDTCLDQIELVLKDNLDSAGVEVELEKILQTYLEDSKIQVQNEKLTETLKNLPKDCIDLILWGKLVGEKFLIPHTSSLDYNRDVTRLMKFIEVEVTTKEVGAIEFGYKSYLCKIDEVEVKNTKALFPRLDIIKNFRKLLLQNADEAKARIKALSNFIESFMETIKAYEELDAAKRHELDRLRYAIDDEEEYFLFKRLDKSYPHLAEILRKNTENVEWVNEW